MSRIKKVCVTGLLIISFSIFSLGLYWQHFIQTAVNVPKPGLLFFIKPGDNLREIAFNLKKKKVINNKKVRKKRKMKGEPE